MTNHLFVLIGSISSICPVISNSILKTVKRRLCPLSTMFPHATYFDDQGHNEMSTATAWRKLGMCLNHQFFRIFWDHILVDLSCLIPQKNWVLFTDPCEMVRRNLYSVFFGNRVLEFGKVHCLILWKHREKWHEMTWKQCLWWPPPSLEEVSKHHGPRRPLGLGWLINAKSTPGLWWEQKIGVDIMTSRSYVQLLLCNKLIFNSQGIVFPWEIKTLERKFCP